MGCGGSKLEESSEALVLCRSRCHNLSEAIRLRYALADAHSSYVKSLHGIGISLYRFFLVTDMIPSSSPVLMLPAQRKGDPLQPPPAVPSRHSHSNSGHIQFLPSEGDSDDDDDGLLLSDSSSPLHHPGEQEETTTFTSTTTNFHFAKKGPPAAAAMTYEQRPEIGQVQVGGFGAGDSSLYPYHYADPYNNNISNNQSYGGADTAYPYAYPYPYPPAYGGMGGGFFASASQQQLPPPAGGPAASSSHPPPDPPSPPKASTWDFLNPFESFDSYYQNHTPSRSSRELREEEGIPDLEDEEQEVVKEAYGDRKLKAGSSASAADGEERHWSGKDVPMEEDGSRGIVQEQHYKMRPSGAGEKPEYDVHVVSKNVVGDEIQKGNSQEGLQLKVVPGSRSVLDAVNEIMAQFDRAGSFGEEVSKMLEVGKLQYHQKKYQEVPSRMRYITPSLSTVSSSIPSTSKSSEISDNASSAYVDNDEEKAMEAGNLSLTLQQLYIWEKKLLDEVKVEEDMRLLHERKSKKLKHLDERGSEPYKIDSARHVVKKLATKIRIAIQVVHSISNRISKLRDEELWPQLRELIHGLVKMWQVLTECHKSQCKAILEAKSLDATFVGKLDVTHREATSQLIMELLNWGESFSCWVDIQKSFVKELNEWLKKCLLYEPEETADGIIPFSPGRLGAPPVFVICNYWSQAIDRISEAEVVEAMNAFTTNVLLVWQHHYADGRQNMVTPDMNRGVKTLDKDNQKIYKAVEAVNKKRTQVDNHGGYPHTRAVILLKNDAKSSSLHSSLHQFFEAMERFTENSLKFYEGLHSRCEEEEKAVRKSAGT